MRDHLPDAIVREPVRRGDLYRDRERGHEVFVVLDGSFSHGFAVSPREVVDVLSSGASVVGGSSMGAIRAAECWPAGMLGVGVVYRLYRRGVLTSDDDVAVVTDPDREHRALTLPLVNIRFGLRRAERRALLEREAAEGLWRRAVDLHYSQRTGDELLRGWHGDAGLRDDIKTCLETTDVKAADARRALSVVARGLSEDRLAKSPTAGLRATVRYPGHDRRYGRPLAELQGELLRWLLGSGRYQNYVWAVVAGSEELRCAEPTAEGRREALVLHLGRALAEPAVLAERFWDELDYLDELDSELANWYAVMRLAAVAGPSVAVSRLVKERVAIAHGAICWAALLEHVSEGRLFGVLPQAWIDDAVTQLSSARTGAERTPG